MEENKKSASPKKNCARGSPDSIVCIKGWHVPTCGFSPQPTEAHRFGCGYPQYAISDGRAASHRDCRGCSTGDADGKRAISPTFVTHPGIARRGNELKIEINQCRI